MKHELPDLPYPKDALAPHVSAETLEFHHDKHHKAYVDKLNQLIVGTEYENLPLEQIVKKSSGPIFNNAGQTWNHTFLWHSMTPEYRPPGGELKAAVDRAFGSLDEFHKKFSEAAVGQFGSGWAWLVKNGDGSVAIETTSNAGTPFAQGKNVLLTCDVWEHAYYIDYRNARPKYLEAFSKVINWNFAERNYRGP